MSSIVLITTATHPPQGVPYLKMTNVAARHLTSKAAVFWWAAHGIEKIVIADATGATLLHSEEASMLRQMNVDVEQISYEQDVEVTKDKGKGHAEGELIRFALANSVFLAETPNFFKCTGKVYCRNFHEIYGMIERNGIRNIFWRNIDTGDLLESRMDLRFFYTTRHFCETHLLPAYQQADDKSASAEYYCFKTLQEQLLAGTALRPMLSGFCGGTGKPYFDSSLGALDAHYPCWAEMA